MALWFLIGIALGLIWHYQLIRRLLQGDHEPRLLEAPRPKPQWCPWGHEINDRRGGTWCYRCEEWNR